MAVTEKYDLAVWDVNGELTAGIRRHLRRLSRHLGPQIAVESGDWLGRRVAVGVPQRLTAAQAGTLSGCLRAMALGHPARQRVVIGPAVAISGRGAIGDVVVAASVISADETFDVEPPTLTTGPNVGAVGDGRLPWSAEASLTTDWAGVAARVAAEGASSLIVAVVTGVSGADPVTPPSSRRRTRSREAGAFLGRLLAGQSDDGSNAKCVQRVTEAIQQILQSS